MSWGSVFWVARRPRHAALLETMANDNRNASFAVVFFLLCSYVFLMFCISINHVREESSKVPKVHFKMWIFTGTLAILCWIFNQKAGSIHQTGLMCQGTNDFSMDECHIWTFLKYGWMDWMDCACHIIVMFVQHNLFRSIQQVGR